MSEGASIQELNFGGFKFRRKSFYEWEYWHEEYEGETPLQSVTPGWYPHFGYSHDSRIIQAALMELAALRERVRALELDLEFCMNRAGDTPESNEPNPRDEALTDIYQRVRAALAAGKEAGEDD